MPITCFIRYQIDPFQREAFARNLLGYFLPWEGTSHIAWGLISFDSLAAYEVYRNRLKADPEARANFGLAQSKRRREPSGDHRHLQVILPRRRCASFTPDCRGAPFLPPLTALHEPHRRGATYGIPEITL